MKQAIRAIVVRDNMLLVMKRNKFGKQYYTLIGGGIELHETPEVALHRELAEETGMHVGANRLVFVEEAPEPYGTQYVYWCEYLGGDPVLSQASEEALISQDGKNTYEPMWLAISELPDVPFVSEVLRHALIESFARGFPGSPVRLSENP